MTLISIYSKTTVRLNILPSFFVTMGSTNLFVKIPVTATSASIIDHAYVSHPHNIRETKIVKIGCSDHFPICLVFEKNFSFKNKHIYITYWSFKHFNETEFLNDLSNSPWNIIDASDNDYIDDMLDL